MSGRRQKAFEDDRAVMDDWPAEEAELDSEQLMGLEARGIQRRPPYLDFEVWGQHRPSRNSKQEPGELGAELRDQSGNAPRNQSAGSSNPRPFCWCERQRLHTVGAGTVCPVFWPGKFKSVSN